MYLINNYDPLTIPEHLEFQPVMDGDKQATDFDGQKKFKLFINGEPVKCINQHLRSCSWPCDDYVIPENRVGRLMQGFANLATKFPFEVRNFEYNGFMGKMLPGVAEYRAQFLRWSGDPGVAVMICSDGKERFIPTFAIEGAHLALPMDDTEFEDKVMFGCPSNS